MSQGSILICKGKNVQLFDISRLEDETIRRSRKAGNLIFSDVTWYLSSDVTSYLSSDVTSYLSSDMTSYISSDVTSYLSSDMTSYLSSDVTSYLSSDVTSYLRKTDAFITPPSKFNKPLIQEVLPLKVNHSRTSRFQYLE
jgi:hypothetical protein